MRTTIIALFVLLLATTFAVAQATPSNPSHQATTTANPETGSQQTPPAKTEPSDNPQTPPTPSQSAASTGATVTSGTEIKATLDTPLSTRTSRVGDRFTATIQQPVPAENGGTAIPSGAHLNGEVTQIQPGRDLPQLRGKGRLSLRFREVVLPNGATFPLAATLVSIRDTKSTKAAAPNEEGQVHSTASAPALAKDAGIGSITGLAFGSALRGFAIGAAAGGGSVLATQGKDVNLPANSGLVLRLDQPLTIPPSASPGE